MIYIDSSVVLSYLLDEQRQPPAALWEEQLISSRLLELEVWTVLNRQRITRGHGADVEPLISRVALIELIPEVLYRAREPFPQPVRTLDALHLAAADFVRAFRRDLRFATYDARLAAGAESIGMTLVSLA